MSREARGARRPFEQCVPERHDIVRRAGIRVVPIHPEVVPGARLLVLDHLHIATSFLDIAIALLSQFWYIISENMKGFHQICLQI